MVSAAAAAAALSVSGCGRATHYTPAAQQTVTFATTQPTPTTTVASATTVPTLGPQGVRLETGKFLAAASSTALATPVHGILCQQLPQLAYRSYVHLQVYAHGASRALPGGIGMIGTAVSPAPGGLVYSADTCYYWLQTRAADGVILVESPKRRGFTLGAFFAIWRQPLSRHRVAGLLGIVTARVNGKRWRGDVTAIPLRNHTNIELAVGKPVPAARATDWIGAGL